ncbi:hypothetical protein CAEBREN_03546 [Caenorhabditis brenneri]|uniref:Uncharacterized protein n=1 Tax=Caenorhabditis brenneri TaxID=135651 RepID=G0NXF7_CAEBE|nr:hypothetical protein CAEBREN_03546 [Caenorhabditis brenneri]
MTDFHQNERTLYESSGMPKIEKAPVYSDGIPTLLKVNQVTFSSSEMSSDESATALDAVTQSIALVQIALTTGIKSIETLEHSTGQEKWLKGLNVVAGCSEIVKGFVMFMPTPEEPLVQKLRKLGHALDKALLESAAIGFFNIKNRKNLDFINKETLIANQKLELWKEELEKDEGYWKETEEFLKVYVPAEKKLTLNAMAHVIEKHLASYMTSDCFTIVAMNDGELHDHFPFHCPKEKERIIGYWGGDQDCTIFIYRTRHMEKVSRKDFLRLVDELYNCKELPYWENLNGIIDLKLIKPGKLQDYGFVSIIDHRNNPFILFVNHSTGGNNYIGNGTFAHVDMKSDTGETKRGFKICASFD